MKKADIFDLEQRFMQCWQVIDDVNDTANYILDNPMFKNMDPKHADKLYNLLNGISELYNLKFELCWEEFEAVVKEYHRRGNES